MQSMNAVVVVNFLRTINAVFALQGLPSYLHTISDMSFSTLEIGAAQLRVRYRNRADIKVLMRTLEVLM